MVALLAIIAFLGIWPVMGRQPWSVGSAILIAAYCLSMFGLALMIYSAMKGALKRNAEKPLRHLMFTQWIISIIILEIMTLYQIVDTHYAPGNSLVVAAFSIGIVLLACVWLIHMRIEPALHSRTSIVFGLVAIASSVALLYATMVIAFLTIYVLCPVWITQFSTAVYRFSRGSRLRLRGVIFALVLLIAAEIFLTITGNEGRNP